MDKSEQWFKSITGGRRFYRAPVLKPGNLIYNVQHFISCGGGQRFIPKHVVMLQHATNSPSHYFSMAEGRKRGHFQARDFDI